MRKNEANLGQTTWIEKYHILSYVRPKQDLLCYDPRLRRYTGKRKPQGKPVLRLWALLI